jgi:hypothetical protein
MSELSAEAVVIVGVMAATLVAFVIATVLYSRELARQRQAIKYIQDEIKSAAREIVTTQLEQERRAALADVEVREDAVMDLLEQIALDATGTRLKLETVLSVRDEPVPALVLAGANGVGNAEVVFTPAGEAYRANVLARAGRDRDVVAYSVAPSPDNLVVDEELRQSWQLMAGKFSVTQTALPRTSTWDVLVVPSATNGRG